MAKQKTKKPHITPALKLIRAAFSILGAVIPSVMGRWAYQIWFTPVRFNTPKHEIKACSSAKNSTINVNGLPVSVLSWGEGPVVLFIHGWSGRASQASHFVSELVNSGYRVISFDGPAHGNTPGKQTNLLEMTDVVREMERNFGPFYAAITHSFGGMIMAYAMSLGTRFEKSVCICPPADIEILIYNFKRTLSIPEASITVMLKKLENEFGSELWDKISTIRNASNFTNKALIIHDEDDADVPWQSGQAIADAWQGSKFMLTHGLGHRRILRDPKVINATTRFIASD